jgi:hypothetical protein
MEGSFNNKERRSHPRVIIDLPLEYRDMNGSCLGGATLVNASDGGFLIESPRDIPVGTELSITVLFPEGLNWLISKSRPKLCGRDLIGKETGNETSTGRDINMD